MACFLSSSIIVQAGGHLPFGLAQSDDRTIWIKLKFNHLFRHDFQSTASLVCRRLQCQNPRVVANFQQSHNQFLLQMEHFKERVCCNKPLNKVDGIFF